MADTDAAADTRTPEQVEIDRLRSELDHFTKSGIIEIAVRNSSVFEYMKHWEGRAEAAEATISALEAENKRLREAVEPFKTFAEHTVEQVDSSWTWKDLQNDRIRDWFGPSDFGAARATFSAGDEATPAACFAKWLEDGPRLAKAAGCHVGIRVTPAALKAEDSLHG